MKIELMEKLQKIIHSLRDAEDVGREKLEALGEEAMTAFDKAITAVDRKIKISDEVKKYKEFFKRFKVGFLKASLPLNVRYILAVPFIYGMIIPALFLHLTAEIYQQISFRLYKIPRVKAREYFIFERAHLPFLNWMEKFNCVYCSYVNNLFQFVVEIAGRTERYWCPIKYANRIKKTHSQYELFIDFMDAPSFREKWEKLKDFSDLKEKDSPNP